MNWTILYSGSVGYNYVWKKFNEHQQCGEIKFSLILPRFIPKVGFIQLVSGSFVSINSDKSSYLIIVNKKSKDILRNKIKISKGGRHLEEK